MKSIIRHTLLSLAGVLLVSSQAFAATAGDNLAVSAGVTANCLITTTALAFGNYDPIGTHSSANLDGTGTLLVTCTAGATGVTISLGQGQNTTRQMLHATSVALLDYELYTTTGRDTPWGLNVPMIDGTGTQQTITVYGRIASGQNKPVGTYNDTVVATVNF